MKSEQAGQRPRREQRQVGRGVAGHVQPRRACCSHSFVPPAPARRLHDYTALRVDLTSERARYWQRLEKLPEDALIKVLGGASKLDTVSVRDMLEALIAGERDPGQLADLARRRMRVKHGALVEALTGRFDDHHAERSRMLLTGLTPSARGSNPNHPHRRPTERPDRRGSHSATPTRGRPAASQARSSSATPWPPDRRVRCSRVSTRSPAPDGSGYS